MACGTTALPSRRCLPPLKNNFQPSETHFSSTSPSLGFRHSFGAGFKLHGTVGRGYVAPDAHQLTGEAVTTYANGSLALFRGDGNLKPESSLTWDLGLGWGNERAALDLTFFRTEVKDKITSNIVRQGLNTINTYVNANKGVMSGVELDLQAKLHRCFTFAFAATHYFKAQENVAGKWVDVNNVARQTLRASVDFQQGPWESRLGWRFVGRTKDNDWTYNSGRQVEFPSFGTLDLSVKYNFNENHSIQLKVENLADRFYSEKFGFPQSGRGFSLSYCWRF